MNQASTLQVSAPLSKALKTPINWLLIFVPLGVVLDYVSGVPAPVIFFSASLAIIPIAAMIVRATEQLASRTGDAVGGLLNATFGNAPELIISLVALKAGFPRDGPGFTGRRDSSESTVGPGRRLLSGRSPLSRATI